MLLMPVLTMGREGGDHPAQRCVGSKTDSGNPGEDQGSAGVGKGMVDKWQPAALPASRSPCVPKASSLSGLPLLPPPFLVPLGDRRGRKGWKVW